MPSYRTQRYSRRTCGNNAYRAFTIYADDLTISSIRSPFHPLLAYCRRILYHRLSTCLFRTHWRESLPLLRLRTAYSQYPKYTYSNIRLYGPRGVDITKIGPFSFPHDANIIANVEIESRSGENVEWHWVGGASLSPFEYRPLAKADSDSLFQYAYFAR